MKIWCMYCNREEELEYSCVWLLKNAEEEVKNFWEMVMSLERNRSIEKQIAWEEFYSKINTFLAIFLGDFYIKPFKRKNLYPKLEEIDKRYDEKRRKLDWERIRKIELWRVNMLSKWLKETYEKGKEN